MSLESELRSTIELLPLSDTHEHLFEETRRQAPGDDWALQDFALLFMQYAISDLVSAGMPGDEAKKLTLAFVSPEEKWRLLAPWWERIRHTGYGQCITRTIRILYGIEELNASTWQAVNDAVRQLIRPGYYREILQGTARLDHLQVNTLEPHVFCESDDPTFLLQDLSILQLTVDPPIELLHRITGIGITNLARMIDVVDCCFERYGPRAIALKSQAAYRRGLDYAPTDRSDAEKSFSLFLRSPGPLSPTESKPFEDYLFHHCMRKAREYKLPVKLHTGYFAGTGHMPLHRVGANGGDICPILQADPDIPFILMHSMYPYQDQAIALAKHYPNAYIDLCWSWIVAPVATRRFLAEFLTAAPVNKVLPFGGDFMMAELVVGHASMARDGIAGALSDLARLGFLGESDLVPLSRQIMTENAAALFPAIDRLRANPA